VHCSAYTLQYWREQGYDVTAYWYNPNIHPNMEHQQRLESLGAYLKGKSIELIWENDYNPADYYAAIGNRGENRCIGCYSIRLVKTREYAEGAGYDGFTSSLLISLQQDHQSVIDQALRATGETGSRFKYADIRKSYSESRRMTKQRPWLYRQTYCGCSFSEAEAAEKLRYKELLQLDEPQP
jgi:predicted adenine nucleotide alpha hydrolase (AANH) superfamily ATPase